MTSRGWIDSLLAMQIFLLIVVCLSGIEALRRKEESHMLLAFKSEIQNYQSKYGNSYINAILVDDVESKVIFYLFWRSNPEVPDTLVPGNVSSLTNSHFDLNKPTKVLVHGFLDSVSGEMVTTVKKSFLDEMDVNVLVVDWSKISINIDYVGVAKKTKQVGQYLAKMLDFLSSQGYDFSGLHLIGHSLGSHVCGYAGRSVLQGVIPRISGLDPALPGFEVIDVAERLKKSDATFVDIIHTCSGLLGIFDAIGHADFYPNGGTHPQPGCPFLDAGKCSHLRAFQFYAESINPNHQFPTERCTSPFEMFSKCNVTSVVMGYPLNSSVRGIYIGHTDSEYPFAPDVL